MWEIFVHSVRSGVRGRSIHGTLAVGILLIGVAYLSSAFSPRQPAAVALDVGLSGIRFALVLFALVWVNELIGKEIERKTVMFSLAYPVPRSYFVLGRYLGALFLLAVAVAVLGGILVLAVMQGGAGLDARFQKALDVAYFATLAGLWLDVAVVMAFATLIACLSTVPFLAVALGALFAIMGKSLGAVIDYLQHGEGADSALAAQYGPVLDVAKWILPDLSRLDWRAWPMYDMQPAMGAMGLAVASALIYMALMLALAILAINRRQYA